MKSESHQFKSNTIIAIIVFINFLFAFKYIARYTEYSFPISVLLSIFYYYLLAGKNFRFSNKTGYTIICIVSILFVAASIYIFRKISPDTLNVDRWSVITSFWDAFLNGQYPYFAKSHAGNPPGPMPFYFILAFPFYLFKELGLISITGSLLLIILMVVIKINVNTILKITLLMFSSIFYLWEVVSRSNILFNSVLIVMVLIHFHYHLKSRNKFYLNAIIAGLMLSTRSLLIIPYIIIIINAIKQKEFHLKFAIIYLSLLFIVFISTFLPFIIIFPNDFMIMNPLIVQSTFFLPTEFSIVFLLIALIAGISAKSKIDTYFYSGICLFISILIYFVYLISANGFYNAYIQSVADISYFIFCIPFLIIYYVQPQSIVTK